MPQGSSEERKSRAGLRTWIPRTPTFLLLSVFTTKEFSTLSWQKTESLLSEMLNQISLIWIGVAFLIETKV